MDQRTEEAAAGSADTCALPVLVRGPSRTDRWPCTVTKPPEMSSSIVTLEKGDAACGWHPLARPSRPSTALTGMASLGIMIGDHDYWSHGYGTDAIDAAALRLRRDEPAPRLAGGAGRQRPRHACYRKCGFIEEGRKRDRYRAGVYHDTIMGVLEDEFRALHAVRHDLDTIHRTGRGRCYDHVVSAVDDVRSMSSWPKLRPYVVKTSSSSPAARDA